ncbi:MAG: alcohol dehydrogenase [Porticoccaceae bacterium]|nr:alcohol dehydrogenase [Porticoccaceae bacterium]
MGRLKDKVAVITGAASGIGRASALGFGAEGARVVVTDLRVEGAEKVAEEICAGGGQAVGIEVDAGDEGHLKAMIDRAVTDFGRIDLLFNNALNTRPDTIQRDMDFLKFDVEVFEINMRVNCLGGVLASKYAIPHMLEQGGGSIIFTSSTSALGGEITAFTYGATKAAVNWYVQTIAATYGKQGIRCNAIAPGVMVTPSQQAWSNPEMDAAFLDIQNVRRLGKPEDIANMALFLASDESEFCNGTVYEVNGGMNCATPMVPVVRRLLK